VVLVSWRRLVNARSPDQNSCTVLTGTLLASTNRLRCGRTMWLMLKSTSTEGLEEVLIFNEKVHIVHTCPKRDPLGTVVWPTVGGHKSARLGCFTPKCPYNT
jgi:hypothetical protein